jgi:hypothetical protein
MADFTVEQLRREVKLAKAMLYTAEMKLAEAQHEVNNRKLRLIHYTNLLNGAECEPKETL